MSFVKENYENKVAKSLKEKFGYKNELEIPRLEKVCLNVAFKTADVDNNFLTYVCFYDIIYVQFVWGL